MRGLENLRLAQYTVQRYFTSVTRSQQETGNSQPQKRVVWGEHRRPYESRSTQPHFLLVKRGDRSRRTGFWW